MKRCWRKVWVGLVLTAAAPAWSQFGQNKITYHDFQWQVYESPHFNVHYYPEIEPFLEEVVSYAESAYVVLSRELDHELRFRVPLVIYKTHGEFQQTNITLSELPEGVAAFAEPVQNRMVLPIDLPSDKLYQLISHELVHIFQYSIFYEGSLGRALRSNPPAWLIEGMASYFAKDEDSLDEMAIRDAVVNNIIPPIQTMHQPTFLAYRFGHAVFDFIEQEHGKEGLRTFLFEYRKVLLTNNIEKAIKESFGYDVATFDRRFNAYLRKKYFSILLDRKSPDDYGTEIGVKKPGVFTFSPTISPSGELVAALASPKLELDLMVLSADDGTTVKNLTEGWTNDYRTLVTEAFKGRRDVSWSPAADRVAVFARRENKWPLLVFDALKGRKVHEIVLDDIVECSSPSFSPDGRRVAFEGNRAGVVDLFEVDLETGAVRNLTQDDFYDANPWYSPDGTALLYNRRIGSYWKIFSVSAADPSRKTQMTFGPHNDIQPAYSRNGEVVYYASDHGEGRVFNIFALDLSTGDIEQYTNVVSGCFAPVEMAEREGDRYLVFAAFYSGVFRLYRMPLHEPERTLEAAERLSDPLEAEPFEPPLSLTLDEERKNPYRRKWDIESPYVEVGVTDDGTFLANAAVQFSDLLGNHRVRISAATVADFANYSALYVNLKRRFDWGAAVYDYRDYFLIATTNGVEQEQVSRSTGVSAFIEYPLSRYTRVEASTGFVDSSQDLLVTDSTSPTGFDYQPFDDRFATVGLSLTNDTTRFQSFGPFQGRRVYLSTVWGPHISGDFEGDIVEHRLDFRAYRQMTRRSLIAVRLASIYNTGERENSYGFGGLNQLRGFDFREFAGSRMAWANLELRFPLIDEMRFPILRLVQIRGFFFLDVGAAWYTDNLWYDPDLVFPGGFQGGIRSDVNGPVPFDFWDSDNDRLQDGRASYGAGFQFFFLGGLQFNWIWANPIDYTQYQFDSSLVLVPTKGQRDGSAMEFYIAFDF